MSESSVVTFQGSESASSGGSWDPQALVPEQLRWISSLPGPSPMRAYERADRQIRDVGACEQPVWLRGSSLAIALASSEVIGEFSSVDTPFGAVPVRCMNRRRSRCAPCSQLYRGDAYHLAWSGMAGGKGVPESVSVNPQVFATFTAPSFGAVHRVSAKGDPDDKCRARCGFPVCPHGRALFCAARHLPGGGLIGTALCCCCYDYAGQALFNALASKLWKALTDTLYHHLASLGGVPRWQIRRLVRVEYVKVAEYQARGVVHFHVVVRLDGPGAAGDPPPSWATAELLAGAVKSAAGAVSVAAPASDVVGDRVFRFGSQVDARAIEPGGEVSDRKVSGYLAKYTTKSTEDAGGADRPITHASQIEVSGRTAHVRALMWAAWRLGGLPEFKVLNIRHWTHMLGYRGHATTKSVRYSVTFTELRGARAAYKAGPAAVVPGGVVTRGSFAYAFSGYPSVSLRLYAAQVRDDIEENRRLAKEALDLERWERSRPRSRAGAVP
jgi:hypothetical protein